MFGKACGDRIMIRIETRKEEPIDKALRRFKKQCEKEGLTKDIKKNTYYEKPSEKKRRLERKLVKRSGRDDNRRNYY